MKFDADTGWTRLTYTETPVRSYMFTTPRLTSEEALLLDAFIQVVEQHAYGNGIMDAATGVKTAINRILKPDG